MNSAEKQTVLHCLKSMIDEEVCEECPLYGMTGTDHCEKDCVRLAINELSSSENPNKWIDAEVLDKIRAEIMDINVVRDEYSQRQNDYCDGVEFAKRYVLQIIDKYKAEGSDKK